MTRRVRIATIQFDHRPITSFDQFAAQVAHYVRLAEDAECHLAVFPEYLTAPLTMMDPDWERWTAPYQELFSGLACSTKLTILGGTHLTKKEGGLHNTAHLFLPSGELYQQDKIHMTPCEIDPWCLGRGDGVKVFDTPAGRLAIQVCFDSEFPEPTRLAAEAGADLILVPSATDDKQGFWRVRYSCHARAIENQVYIVHSALVGGLPVRFLEQSVGRSGIITPCDIPFPQGGVLTDGDWNQGMAVIGEVDLDLLASVRERGSVMPRRERRPEAYFVEMGNGATPEGRE